MTLTQVNTQGHRSRVPLLAVAAIAAISLITSSCADDEDTASTITTLTVQSPSQPETAEDAVASTDDEGTTSIDDARLADELDTLPVTTVSDAERDGLVFMREEEKLALDVYTALYDDLVTRGSESVTEALLVGALIEDLDIADLQARARDDPAIALVFGNLEQASRNHLRAFIRQLDAEGATCTPSYISQTDFDAIINSPTERGNRK